mmetsp:Transcript_11354/g.18991  ORF Transcript_11354/g.18991 Transcript_11354/m.18991 type:complete len:394 (-) Transcript_11354:39-1220(-)
MSVTPFKSFSTKALHVGSNPDPHTGAVIPALSLSSTFAQKSPGEFYPGNFEYSRSDNPSRNNFEAAVAAIEGGDYGLAFGSGSAVLATVLGVLKRGDHVLAGDDVYGGTNRFLNKVAIPNQGLSVDMVDFTDLEVVKKSLKKETKVVWLETPTNPTLKVFDIQEIGKIVKAFNKDITFVVDNTFLSPYFQNPLSLGADVVVHSVSKYINGHSDVVMGVLATSNEDLKNQYKFLQNAVGAIPAPFDCYQAHRGLKTLAVRMQRHEENAKILANYLEKHAKIAKVSYPGLASHPQHEIAKKQQTGYGGMITFWIKGDLSNARQFLENLNVITLAESLGGIESLIEHPAIMTHASVPAEQRKQLGIDDTLVRFSVGIENVEDLEKDLLSALEHVTV